MSLRARLRGGLYGMVDPSAGGTVEAIADGLLDAGVLVLQLRLKNAADATFRAALERLLARAGDALIIVNDRLDVAADYPGVGLHLGQDDGDPAAARARLGDRVLGVSTHAAGAAPAVADYIGFGPVFGAAGKHRWAGDARAPMAPRGLDALRAAVAASPVPVVAIGGVGLGDAAAVRATGAAAAACIGAVSGAADVAAAARAFQAAWAAG